jgi:hypothetical protein
MITTLSIIINNSSIMVSFIIIVIISSSTWLPLLILVYPFNDFYSGCPNQEIGRPFLFKGLVVRTTSYFGADSTTTINIVPLPLGPPSGVAKYGAPLSLDSSLKVDIIMVGSSVVSTNGCRLGKGEVGAV